MTTVLEEWIYRKSHGITGQTQGIVDDIHARIPKKPIHWLPNGIDSDFLEREIPKANKSKFGAKADSFTIGYAGVLGLAQGLEIIIQAAERLKNENVEFLVAGSGPVEGMLKENIKEKGMSNVILVGSLMKDEMPEFLASVDAALVPLKKSDLFLGAIPSKIFENAAYEKPIILGVDGEARDLFVNQGKAGIFYEPENSEDLEIQIRKLISNREWATQLGQNGRKYVKSFFLRETISEKLEGFLTKL